MRHLFAVLTLLWITEPLHAQVRTERVSHTISPAAAKSSGILREIESDPIPVGVAGEPFVSIAPSMRLPQGGGSHARILLRVSADGTRWGDWVDAGHDHHAEVGPDIVQGNLVFFPSDSRYVQYRIVAGLIDAMPQEVDLFMVNPGRSEEGDMRRKTPDFQVNTSSAYPLPSYVPRSSWGASLGLNNLSGATPITVTHLWVHHSAGQTNSSDFAAVVRSYHVYHTGPSLNWSDIGYNWLVDPNGVVYQGRAHSLNVFTGAGNPDVAGAHAGNVNSRTMGICVIGDYTNIVPSAAATTKLRTMLAWKAHEKGMNVLGTGLIGSISYNIISGHRDNTVTSCPGDSFYPTLPTLRRRVHAYLNPPEAMFGRIEPVTPGAASMRVEAVILPKRSATVWYLEYATNPQFTGSGTTPERTIAFGESNPITVSETIAGLQLGSTYYGRIVAVNSDTSFVSTTQAFVAGQTTSVDSDSDIAGGFELIGNYPNPFNPSTMVSWRLAVSGQVRVSVHDVLGREVAVLVDGPMPAGHHHATFDASGLGSGVYVVRLSDGVRSQTRKMLLLH